jgi:hypothetical protein
MSVTWSCRSIKSTSEKNTATSKTDKKEVRNDSISNTLTNAEIKDRIVINVPETDNSELMEMFNSLLHRLNTSKTSGGNSYQMRYDEGTRQLIADIKVAATKFQDTKVTSDRLIETTFEEKTDAYFTKKIKAIPWWFYAIAVYLLRSHVINFLSFFIPGIKNIKTLRDLLKSP